jgi:choline dehydrogenase
MKTVFFLAGCFTAAVPGRALRSRDCSPAANQTFDYVVVGCGVAGLVVAARLSEDPDASVICIEAGTL